MLRIAALALVLGLGTVACGEVRYTVTDLGTLGGPSSSASSINNLGQVAGASYYTNTQPYDHPFLYSSGTMTDLGGLGGYRGWANGINNSGQVVGASNQPNNVEQSAFLYSGGVMTSLNTQGSSFNPTLSSEARAINDKGQIAGWAVSLDGTKHPFLYSNGHMTDLGLFSGGFEGEAHAVNYSGQVAGYSGGGGGDYNHAFLYSNGVLNDLGTLGGSFSVANGINNAGKVVGVSYSHISQMSLTILW